MCRGEMVPRKRQEREKVLDDLYRPAVAQHPVGLRVAALPLVPCRDGLQARALGRGQPADSEDAHLLAKKVDDAWAFVLHKIGVVLSHEAIRFVGHFSSSSSFGVWVFRVEALAGVDFHESGLCRFLDAENGYNFVFHNKVLMPPGVDRESVVAAAGFPKEERPFVFVLASVRCRKAYVFKVPHKSKSSCPCLRLIVCLSCPPPSGSSICTKVPLLFVLRSLGLSGLRPLLATTIEFLIFHHENQPLKTLPMRQVGSKTHSLAVLGGGSICLLFLFIIGCFFFILKNHR